MRSASSVTESTGNSLRHRIGQLHKMALKENQRRQNGEGNAEALSDQCFQGISGGAIQKVRGGRSGTRLC